MRHLPVYDFSRFAFTHDLLSSSTAIATAPLALASAPQATFEVTTLADVVDASDGVLSLREAIQFANDNPGRDTISFAPALFGGTIVLNDNLPTIVDDLLIDGDSLNRGSSAVTIDGGAKTPPSGFGPLFVTNADLRLEDLSLADSYGAGVQAYQSSLAMSRVAIDGVRSLGPGIGVVVEGGSADIQDSRITEASAPNGGGIELLGGAVLKLDNVVISNVGGDGGFGVKGKGSVSIVDSEFNRVGGQLAASAVSIDGDVSIFGSTIASTSGEFYSYGVRATGDLLIINSTIAEIYTRNQFPSGSIDSFAIDVPDGATATIVNSTITGVANINFVDGGEILGTALRVAPEASAEVYNSIFDGKVEGKIFSNGRNIFRESADGSVSTDVQGVTPEEVFRATDTFFDTSFTFGQLSDNGGPTQTVALLNSPDNPALDAADPVTAPATDQRGFVRDATPDIGSFELDAQPFDRGLVVTTLDDVVLVDGEISLREAILTANATPGLDTITFAESLRGGRIVLDDNLGTLVITDELVIDGDPRNAGAGAIVIDGGEPLLSSSDGPIGVQAFEVLGTSARLEDLTVLNSFGYGVKGIDADLELVRSAIDGTRSYPGATGIHASGGTLALVDSTVSGSSGQFVAIGVVIEDGTQASVIGSQIFDNSGGDFGIAIRGAGDLTVIGSEISSYGITSATGIDLAGTLLVRDSTIVTGAGDAGGRGIRIDGEVLVANSTIAGGDRTNFGYFGVGLELLSGSHGRVENATLSGQPAFGFLDGYSQENFRPGIGFLVAPEAELVVVNSIVDDGIVGSIISNGANTFRDMAVDGAVAGDRLGATADQLFAQTRELEIVETGPSGVFAGVLADNGGPTRTIALLDDPSNPALDAADPATAPAVDQRGFLRDATPDIGAFELGAEPPREVPPLPPLAEGVAVPDEAINSVPREALTLTGGRDAAISFVDEYAGFQNSLGVYLVGPDGEITAPRWVFERIQHALPDDSVAPSVRPGGGPSQPGDTVWLSDLYDPAELQEGTEFGLFLVADGAARNPFIVFDHGTLEFRSGGGVAKVTDTTPELVHIAETGVERVLLGDIMHTVDAGSPNPLSNMLNPPAVRYPTGGRGQALSGLLDGEFTIAFEDQPLNFGDRDFNDLLLAVELLDASPALFAAPTSAGDTVSAVASLETLVLDGETAA